MKKILIFSLSYYPHVGGAEVAIKEITDRIAPEDVTFHMVTLRFSNESETEQVGNVLVHRVGGGSGFLSKAFFIPRATLALKRLHRREHFDGAWAMLSYMVWPLVLARLLGVRLPYVLTLQDGDPFGHVFERWHIRVFLPLLRYGFQKASVVTALSHYLSAWVRTLGYQRPVAVIPNGADIKRFSQATPADIGRQDGETWLVTSSRLVYKNATDDVIRALALLPEHVKFLVLGEGPDEDMLRSLAQELGISDRVVFNGFVSHEELPSYLHACDIFIRPSRTEGFGASFPEAMAAGLPIIATQEGGIADFLFDARRNPDKEATGFAVDKDAPEQIAKVVTHIIEHPDETKRTVVNAKLLVEKKYDWRRIAKRMREEAFEAIF